MMKAIERNTIALTELVRNADLLLSPSNCPEGRLAHELTGTPWMSVILVPQDARPADAETDERGAEPLAGKSLLGELNRRLGLKRPILSRREFIRSNPTLFACSRALWLCEDEDVVQTGFWFYEDPEWAAWKPADRLAEFMSEGEPPIILSFSSLPLENPREVLEVHVRAAQLLNMKLVVQQGWSGFSMDLLPSDVDRDRIYMTDFLPHDWFFSRASGLITHGGVGTLGRALRNRLPVLVEPYGNDQFFNALLVKQRGFGTAVHPHRLTAESLAAVMSATFLGERSRGPLAHAASIIEAEDGLASACRHIENHLDATGAIA